MTGTYATDGYGFPIETCGRCGGTGRYPSIAWDGVCLACQGPGVTHPAGKVAELAGRWRAEYAAMRSVTPAVHYDYEETGERTSWPPVQVGDQIRLNDEPWRTVAAVRPTARIVGEKYIGWPVGWLRGVTLETVLTFTDGSTVITRGELWSRRVDKEAADARRAELVSQAVKAYERLLKTRVTRQATADAKRAAKNAERETLVQQLVETHPELLVLVGDKYADAHGFMADMRAAVLSGKSTDKQVAAAVAGVRRDAEREQAKADLVAAGVTCPTGRLTVEGTVIAVWSRETDFGTAHKMRVVTDEGWSAAGTIDGSGDWLKGRRVRVTATFEQSRTDPLGGFFKRPRVEVLDPATA